MLVSYPALFYYDDTESVPFFVTFPDFENSATQGKNTSDALYMASDWLGITVSDYLANNRNLPDASDINAINLDTLDPYPDELKYNPKLSFKSMVVVDLSSYLDDEQPIKKTLTIPKWADQAGKDMKINFSKTLTEAIANKKIDAN